MDGMEKKDRLLDFFIELLRWKRFIITNFLVVTILAVIISLILPKWYKATSSILPPKDQGMLNLLGVSTSSLRSLSLGQRLGNLANQNLGAYNYLAILKSRTAMDSIVRAYNLIDVYSISDSSMEKAVKALEKNVTFEIQDENYITITVLDKDPRRAADIANSFIDILNTISIQLGTLEARNTREFIEKRLDMAKNDLRKAEDSLRTYQERSGIVISPDAGTSGISAIADLYAMKAKKELELSIAERSVTSENSILQQLRIELNELNKKLAKVPMEGIESIRLYRNATIQQKITEYLLPLYEQAKVDEQKDIPVILVLDNAVPAEHKYLPKRMIIVATAGGLSLLVSLSVVLGSLYFQRLQSEQEGAYLKFKNLLATLKPARFSTGRK